MGEPTQERAVVLNRIWNLPLTGDDALVEIAVAYA